MSGGAKDKKSRPFEEERTLDDEIESALLFPQNVLENYAKFKSITKVSRVLSRYYGRWIDPFDVRQALRENGVKHRTVSSIYDAQLNDDDDVELFGQSCKKKRETPK